MNLEVTKEQVKINIKRAKNGTAHGPDGILNEVIKAAESAILKDIGEVLQHTFQ